MHVGYTCGAPPCPGSLNSGAEGAGGDDRRYGISEKKGELLKGQREERKPKWTVPFYIF